RFAFRRRPAFRYTYPVQLFQRGRRTASCRSLVGAHLSCLLCRPIPDGLGSRGEKRPLIYKRCELGGKIHFLTFFYEYLRDPMLTAVGLVVRGEAAWLHALDIYGGNREEHSPNREIAFPNREIAFPSREVASPNREVAPPNREV